MKIEYRIAKKGEDYYPQVRFKRLFWSKWKRIDYYGVDKYKLCKLPSYYDPKSIDECRLTIDLFDKFIKKESENLEYIKYSPSIKKSTTCKLV